MNFLLNYLSCLILSIRMTDGLFIRQAFSRIYIILNRAHVLEPRTEIGASGYESIFHSKNRIINNKHHITLIRILLLGAFVLSGNGAIAAPESPPNMQTVIPITSDSCPSGADQTFTDFPAYKYELNASHAKALDNLAAQVVSLTKSGKPVRKIRIVGHAAKWGSNDYQQLSEYRALVVESELTSRFADLGVDYSHTLITTEGLGVNCPAGDNSTRSGRAKNRRVEVWLTAVAKIKPPTPVKKKTIEQHLQPLTHSSNPTTQCLAKKLLDPKVDTSYLPIDGLNVFFAQPIQEVGLFGFIDYERDMNQWMSTQLKRIYDVPTKINDASRFALSLQNAQDSLIDGVRALEFFDCYDKRSKIIRNHIQQQSLKATSLYSCPVIKDLVEDKTSAACVGS